MKKNYLLILISFIAFLSSCKKDIGDGAAPVQLTINMYFSGADSLAPLPKEGAIVKASNLTSGLSNETTTNADGVAIFESIPSGIYTITVSQTVAAGVYTDITGIQVSNDVVFNGNLSNEQVLSTNNTIRIPVVAGKLGDWVFKQIYYAGSNTSTGAVFRDQFIEVYNNSNTVLYADSLYFAQVYGSNTAATTDNSGKHGYLPGNQYDWTVALDANHAASAGPRANEDYIYVKSLFMLPGTGKQHPVQPGESIVVAQTAQNHTAPYVMNNGLQQGITDPTQTVDLSTADFEAYLVEYKKGEASDPSSFSPYKWDVDNPGVPNMEVVHFASGNDMILDNLGRDAFVIFKPGNENPRTWKGFAVPTETTVSVSTALYIQVPVQYVIDGVELQRIAERLRNPKRLPNSLDGGPVNVSGGEYSSQSLIRKTARTIGSRRILQDTNNSGNDFLTKTKADPGKTDASFEN